MSRVNDWADDEEELPPTQITTNKDGTLTIVSYSVEPDGKKIKRTQRVKRLVVKDVVHPKVAERAKWTKFGDEAGAPAGPQPSSTAIADNIPFQLSLPKKLTEKTDAAPEESISVTLKCRICTGKHWTSRCPYKDSMMPESEKLDDIGGDDAAPPTGAYIPVNRRAGAAGAETAGKYERDDSTTLRVTNLNDSVEEADLRELFNRCATDKDGRSLGRVVRVFLARDKHTNRLKGFAFINFDNRAAAAAACEKLDGFGFHHLILKVDFPKQTGP